MTDFQKMSNKTDPRVIRTRKLLQDATLELVKEQPYSKISVSDIAERAGVARPTFYLHYRSNDEVIVDYLDSIFENYLEEITPKIHQGPDGIFAQNLFEQVQRNAVKLRPLLESSASHLLMERFRDYITYVSKMLIENGVISLPKPVPQNGADFLLAGITGYFYSVLLEWLEKEMPYSPQEMAAFLIPFINHGLSGMNASLLASEPNQ